MNKLKQSFYCCEVCGKAEIKTVYTVHNRIGNCENCGEYRYKNTILMNNDYSLKIWFEEYAIAWGCEF
jgi:ribosomal protein L37AE/L43A